MFKNFKLVGNARFMWERDSATEGHCTLCNLEITNVENYFADGDAEVRVCMGCAIELSKTYNSVFNHKIKEESKR